MHKNPLKVSCHRRHLYHHQHHFSLLQHRIKQNSENKKTHDKDWAGYQGRHLHSQMPVFARKIMTSASARCIPTHAEVQLKLRATSPPTFQRQHIRRSLHASVYSTQWIKNDVSAKLPNITLASCDLDLWPPDLNVDRSYPCSGGRFLPIFIEIGSLVFEVQRSQVGKRRTNKQTDRLTDGGTDGRTEGQTDGRTDGQVQNIMRPASLDWRTGKYSIFSLSLLC